MTTKNGKVALITGANKGLGKEIAIQLAREGFTVVVAARAEAAGRAVAEAIVKEGGDARAVKLEVTSADEIASLVTYLDKTFGKLDALVNNAGISLEWNAEGTTIERFREVLEVNLIAPWALTTALVPLLSRSNDARVVNQSSILGSITTAGQAWEQMGGFFAPGYATSKAGLNMLSVIQSKSLADKKIAVASAHPGWVKTDLGSSAAPMEVVDGAKTAVGLITMPREAFPHGQFQHLGNQMPW
jgi:NAD(P)-dependent dehydrogenase (short-subunit alcohol dehydrogenase family)